MGRWGYLAAALGTVAALFAAGVIFRNYAGVELSSQALDRLPEWVASLGIWGPAIFLVVATFRVFVLVPSWVLLTAAGVVFGGLLGAILGALGVTLSGLLGFSIARMGGRGWIRDAIQARYGALQARLERAGLAVIAATTAHPGVPMSGLHWAAGLTTLPALGFLLAVGLGATVRSTVLSFLGASLRDLGLVPSLLLGVALIVLASLPLLHAPTRHRLLGRVSPQA